jgi:hypothetical protein
VVETVASERKVEVSALFGMHIDPAAIAARRECYRRVIDQTGCSVKGLAKVWGCDHQSIRRALLKVAA